MVEVGRFQMSDLIEFARSRGIVIDCLPPIGVWKRYPTVDKPRSDNGAVKYLGDHGHVQNHATMIAPETWSADRDSPAYDPIALQREVKKADEDRLAKQRTAALRASALMKGCRLGKHPYLERKGFAEMDGNVFDHPERGLLLVLPMRRGAELVGAQLIDEDGGKKFLYGQASRGAEFVIDAKGPAVLCEGYATALSIRAALASIKMRYTIHVCFSAFNIRVISEALATLPHAIVADHDESGTGERYPKEAGIPYWMPPKVGDDANDFQQRHGLFAASQALRPLILKLKDTTQ